MQHNSLYASSFQSFHQSRQSKQILNPGKGAPLRDNNKRIGSLYIGPARRNRAQFPVLIEKVYPILPPVVAVIDQLEFLFIQRVKQVRDTKFSCPMVAARCSCRIR